MKVFSNPLEVNISSIVLKEAKNTSKLNNTNVIEHFQTQMSIK